MRFNPTCVRRTASDSLFVVRNAHTRVNLGVRLPGMSFEFTATESGFADGFGGASNSEDEDDYHYVLFGRQTDAQHPENSGAYFEFDDQINGGVNLVRKIAVTNCHVTFILTEFKTIRVIRMMDDIGWQEFLRGITESFEPELIQA
jgi:hypothetical protein